ncbi:pyridoxamine 5'-phosphate oxidase family protein [Streptomyces sp. NE06-03E]|uniref:pyridoxamine 5'-phosphate oxidase family protein n=1 Tax=unclassified Streptomyces TaxID=2593676 RepID=UPI0029B33545|nr:MULTISPECIES: pyridoxamine 5'-phosphate oxidase family protein [unclassified Streptomyces]MDX3054297.1 pyridoxamine 5'-phosphate oxidase family protein [Streptomyces sp. NE06-03E]
MGLITSDMRDIVDSAKLSFAATVDEDGSPSLSPKGSVRVWDDQHLIFMDINSPHTLKNLRRDPRLEICAVDFIRRRGYRFKGTVELLAPGHRAYDWLADWLLQQNGPGYPAHEAVLLRVERTLPVLSPAYTFTDISEDSLSQAWAETYGLVASQGSDDS